MKTEKKGQVAVILPVYKNDRDDYLNLAVESILNQTYKDFHLFIGVDGQVGESLTNYLKLEAKQSKVSVIWYKENRGLACVLNDMFDLCFENGYEYIARMDADDISAPNRLEKQMKFLYFHTDIDVVGGVF
jgi:glycosyltransferase involved in cell wall biosynthesis